jgi:tetratricopeptide (TPR) repeat protein
MFVQFDNFVTPLYLLFCLLKYYTQAGDKCQEMNSFEQAIFYYEKAFSSLQELEQAAEAARKARRNAVAAAPDELSTIELESNARYLEDNLARTCMTIGHHKKSIQFYSKCLQRRGVQVPQIEKKLQLMFSVLTEMLKLKGKPDKNIIAILSSDEQARKIHTEISDIMIHLQDSCFILGELKICLNL